MFHFSGPGFSFDIEADNQLAAMSAANDHVHRNGLADYSYAWFGDAPNFRLGHYGAWD